MINDDPSNAPEQCSVAVRLAMRLVRPRTDGRNGLTKIVVQIESKSHLSNAREFGKDSAFVGGRQNTARYAAAS